MLATAAATLLASLPLLLCPEPVAATPTAGAVRHDISFSGLILGDSVNVRAGPGTAYEVVTRLAGGTRVAVLGEAFGWLLVRPEGEVRVYVARDLVEPKGDGIAVVTRDRVNLRSRAALDATVVGQANRGDLVRLIDAAADFVTIAAPPEVAFYVHRDLVRRLPPSEAAAASPVPAAAPAPAASVSPGEKALRARDMYLAELDKSDLNAMDFAEAKRLFEEAAREAVEEGVRATALAGLKRVRIAIELQEDYRRRVGPIERMVTGDQEPCAPKAP